MRLKLCIRSTKKLKEEVKANNIEVVERVINDPVDSLTAGEKKIKSSMEKRAVILQLKSTMTLTEMS